MIILATLPLLSCYGINNNPSSSVRCHCYYVDANKGSDNNDGLSSEKAWRTIDKVNSTSFQPADHILFKSDCRWIGQLRPKGCGKAKAPICIDKYGSGALPIISQGSKSGNVVLLENQDHWEIRNLEIDGGTSKPNQQVGGIQVQATTAGRVLNHIVISGCIIRNTLGSVKLYESSAIWVGVPGWNSKNGLTTSFNDVLIENNQIVHTDRNGILVWTPSGEGPNSQFMHGLIPARKVVIRNNKIEDVGGDAIIVLGSDSALIEKNVVRHCCQRTGNAIYGKDYNPSSAAIWLHHCTNCIMQYNAVYDCSKVGTNNDGMAFDFDYNCKNNILQYNYSCNNAGGFLLIMNTAEHNIARYNISENDRNHVLFCVGKKEDANVVYNNTFYDKVDSAFIVPNALFYNNIFMAEYMASMYVKNPERGIFKNNCYAGNWVTIPTDSAAICKNPMFVCPGKGTLNIENFAGYQLGANSPCLSKGISITDNGGKDILGNKVSSDDTPDVGAVQHR